MCFNWYLQIYDKEVFFKEMWAHIRNNEYSK